MTKGYFVTGTSTGVGKTLASCALLHAFRRQGEIAVGMKPVASGCEEGRCTDVDLLVAASSVTARRELINPYTLIPPIAPHIAARQTGVQINIDTIRKAWFELKAIADVVVVEGIGGFLVPLNDDQHAGDMACALGLPVVLVVRMQLGCLSHALLTAQAVRAAGLALAGWVANGLDPRMVAFDENVLALEQRLDCPLLAVLPYEPTADAKKLSGLFNLSEIAAVSS